MSDNSNTTNKDQLDMSEIAVNLPAAGAALSAEDRVGLVNALKVWPDLSLCKVCMTFEGSVSHAAPVVLSNRSHRINQRNQHRRITQLVIARACRLRQY